MTTERKARIVLLSGAIALALVPTQALAHDGLGGDELAVANWMLVGALITILMGILAGIWAWRNGQFNNVEASKYSMLELSEDYDKVIAEVEEAERIARSQENKPPATQAALLSTGETHALPKSR
jgi:hypothetical protein